MNFESKLEELKTQFQERERLLQLYEKELGPERVKRIQLVAKRRLSSPQPQLQAKSEKLPAPPAHPWLGRDSVLSSTVVDHEGSGEIKRKSNDDHDDLKKTVMANFINKVMADIISRKRKAGSSSPKDGASGQANDKKGRDDGRSSESAKKRKLSSQGRNDEEGHEKNGTEANRHRRAPDSGHLHFCSCGHRAIYLSTLRDHLEHRIYGKVFNCHQPNCKKSFGNGEFQDFKRHCEAAHRIKISAEDGCFMCGYQFKTRELAMEHRSKCPRKAWLDEAMKLPKDAI